MEPMLKVTDLSVSYGHVEALRGVSIQVEQGQIVSIIGANGAGKSTLLRTISGLVKPWSFWANRCRKNRTKSWQKGLCMCRRAARLFPA